MKVKLRGLLSALAFVIGFPLWLYLTVCAVWRLVLFATGGAQTGLIYALPQDLLVVLLNLVVLAYESTKSFSG